MSYTTEQLNKQQQPKKRLLRKQLKWFFGLYVAGLAALGTFQLVSHYLLVALGLPK